MERKNTGVFFSSLASLLKPVASLNKRTVKREIPLFSAMVSCFVRYLQLSLFFHSLWAVPWISEHILTGFFFSQISSGGPIPYIVLRDLSCARITKKIHFFNFGFFPINFTKLFFTIKNYQFTIKKIWTFVEIFFIMDLQGTPLFFLFPQKISFFYMENTRISFILPFLFSFFFLFPFLPITI